MKTPATTPAIADDDVEDVGFLHAVLAQCGLPRNPTQQRTFTRTNGSASILVEAGSWWNGMTWEQMPLPSGTRPRLTLLHACSEAVRTRSPTVELEHSVRAFLRRIRVDTGGKTMKAFREQMLALAACKLTLGYRIENKVVNVKVDPVQEFQAWLQTEDDGQQAMWPGELTLSEPFFRTLLEHAVPLDQRAIAMLQNSSLALDVYTWLVHRLPRVNTSAGVTLSWRTLKAQFGQEYSELRDFKRELDKAIKRTLEAYPEAKVEKVRGGLKLKPSRPPVGRRSHVVAMPASEAPGSQDAPKPAGGPRYVTEDALNKVRAIAPGWDRQHLLATYKSWRAGKPEPDDYDKAFLGWVKSYTKGKPPA